MGDGLILYQDEILKYGRKPNNFGVLADATITAHGDSPICGDHMTLYLKLHASEIVDIKFNSEACCAVCRASSSMMTDALKGITIEHAKRLEAVFLSTVSGTAVAEGEEDLLGDLIVFSKIREVPSRVECAVLSWTTLQSALSEYQQQDKQEQDMTTA